MSPACPSRLRLDEWAAGVRPPEVAAHVGGCDRCAARLDVLAAEHAAFVLRARPIVFADAVLARRRPRTWGWLAFATAAACVLLFVLRPRAPRDDAYEGYKGGPAAASLYVKQGDRVAPHEPGRAYREGDRLQVVVTARRATYVAVVDLEAGGKQTVLFESDAPLPPGRTALPRAFALDDWTGAETIVVLFDEYRITDAVSRAAGGQGDRFLLRRQ